MALICSLRRPPVSHETGLSDFDRPHRANDGLLKFCSRGERRGEGTTRNFRRCIVGQKRTLKPHLFVGMIGRVRNLLACTVVAPLVAFVVVGWITYAEMGAAGSAAIECNTKGGPCSFDGPLKLPTFYILM